MDWKKEFKNFYFSPNVEDIPKAMELKRVNMPSKLYRYRPLNNVERFKDEVIDAHIYMASPKAFNDPFDSSSILKIEELKHSEQIKDRFEKLFRPFADRRIVREIFKHKDWFERLGAYCSYWDMQRTGCKYTDAKFEDISKQYLCNEFEKMNEYINMLTCSLSKVACFTESNTNLPMWTHYAKEHSGVCLEYDFPKIGNAYFINRMFPVFYVKELPNGIKLPIEGHINREVSSDYLLLHKLDDWNYEKEWRLVYNASFWYDSLRTIPKEFYEEGKVIDFIRPSKIYLGYKVSEENEQFVREIGERCNIPVVKMQCTNYGLKTEDESD